jgi:hypothetical protein
MRDDEDTAVKDERIRRRHGGEYEEREDQPDPPDDPDDDESSES